MDAHAVLRAIPLYNLEAHARVEADGSHVHRGGNRPHGAAPAAVGLLEEPLVEPSSRSPRPVIRMDAHEVDVGFVGGATDDTHEKGDDLPVLLDGEARPGKVPEKEPRQLARYLAPAPPIVGDRGAVVRLPELPDIHDQAVYGMEAAKSRGGGSRTTLTPRG